MNDFTTKIIGCLAKGEKMEEMIQELFRSELERAINELLKIELAGFLNYARYEHSGLSSENSRNGSYERKLNTIHGELNLVIPRDRNGEFESPVVPKYERHDTRTEDTIVKLFQTGLTNEEISEIIESLYEKKYSRGTISNITETVIANVEAFKARRLETEYAVIYLDATYVPLRRDTVAKEAIHIALGVKTDGMKEILGYAITPNESVSAWEAVLNDLQSRGVTRPLLFVTDGLKGIEEMIHRVFPLGDIQRCLVHVMRNIAWMVRTRDRAEILNDFKIVHKQETKESAAEVLVKFADKWKKMYPKVIEMLQGNAYLLTFYDYPVDIRRSIYSTNLIEGFNKQVKRKVKAKIQFPSVESTEKYLVSLFEEYNFKQGAKMHKGFGASMFLLEEKLLKKYKD